MTKPKPQAPSVGRIVHFVYGEQHYAAIITDPNWQGSGQQTLTVFPPTEPPFTTVAALDETAQPATWHWPEYVEYVA